MEFLQLLSSDLVNLPFNYKTIKFKTYKNFNFQFWCFLFGFLCPVIAEAAFIFLTVAMKV
jgi:hypothetical protein